MNSILLTTACFSISGIASIAAATLPSGSPSIRIEAEAAFKIIADVGDNSAIGVADGEKDSGQSVTLYDIGDTIQVRVSIPETRTYRIAARVRVGGPAEPLGFWPEGYRFKFDDKPLALVGDESSQSTLDSSYGGCFWGTMLSEGVLLDAGDHTLEVTANATWAVVDFFEITAVGGEPSRLASSGSDNRKLMETDATSLAPTTASRALGRVEAEATFTILRDVGKNGEVGVADGDLDSGESVRLYDQGDTVRIAVSAPEPGEYLLEVRVRSGGSTGATSFWPAGYRVQQDGKPIPLVGKPESISARDASYGGCYWGTMRSEPVTLAAGQHAIDIEATADWGVVDYAQLIRVQPRQSAGALKPHTPLLTTKQP